MFICSTGTSVVFLTLVLLPCVAIALLAGRAILVMIAPLQKWNPWVLGKIVLNPVCFGAAFILARLSWKYRPQFAPERPKPPSCSAQMFE
jgi:hypothetical protein